MLCRCLDGLSAPSESREQPVNLCATKSFSHRASHNLTKQAHNGLASLVLDDVNQNKG
jgi:hypothetical protein